MQEERVRQRRRIMEERAEYERGGGDMDIAGKMVLVSAVLGVVWGLSVVFGNIGSVGRKRNEEEQ